MNKKLCLPFLSYLEAKLFQSRPSTQSRTRPHNDVSDEGYLLLGKLEWLSIQLPLEGEEQRELSFYAFDQIIN
jgi:hypothetical protein